MCGQIVPLDPSNLGLGGREYYSYNTTHPRAKAYMNYMATIAKLLNVTDDNAEKFIDNTIALERQLVQVAELSTFIISFIRNDTIIKFLAYAKKVIRILQLIRIQQTTV